MKNIFETLDENYILFGQIKNMKDIQKGGGINEIDNLKNNLLELDKKIIDIDRLLL